MPAADSGLATQMHRAARVSVIIPAYGHRDYIAAAVQSALDQTRLPHEVIVVNDGSPDDTADVLQSLVRSGHIRYIEQANAGQAAARNRGLAEATGDLVAFLDDDDLWPPDKLAWQVRELDSSASVGVVGGSATMIDAAGRDVGRSPVGDGSVTFGDLFRNGSPFRSPGQTLIRASWLRRIGGFRTHIWGADDYDLWFRLARLGPIRTCDRPSLLYRLHSGNASRDSGRMFCNTLRTVRSHFPHVPPSRRAATERATYWWLYWYLGQGLVADLKRHAASGDLQSTAGLARMLSAGFGNAAARDPRFFKQVLADLLPDRVRRAVIGARTS